MSQSVEPTGRSSPGEAATSCETVTGQTGPLEVPGMTPVGSQSVAHSEGEAPHLCWKTGSCSELCQYCYAHPRERSSAALVPGHSWGGGWRSRIWLHFQFVLCHSPPLQKPKWLWFLGLYLRIRVVGPRLLREPGAAEALEESQVTYWSRPWETSAGLL